MSKQMIWQIDFLLILDNSKLDVFRVWELIIWERKLGNLKRFIRCYLNKASEWQRKSVQSKAKQNKKEHANLQIILVK